MSRILTISSLGLAAVFCVSAAQFQIGLATNQAFSTTVNATTACAGATQNATGYAGCVSGSATAATGGSGASWTSQSGSPTSVYGNNLFSGASSSVNGTASFYPASSYSVSDNAVGTVNLSVNSSGISSPVWEGSGGSGGGTTSLVLPVGIFGANIVWTMLQDAYGVDGNSNTSVVFAFGSGSQTADRGTVTYSLKNGEGIRDAVACSGTVSTGVRTTCDTYSKLTTATVASPVIKNSIASYTQNVYSASYADDVRQSAGAYYHTSGTVNLDAQRFDFLGAHTNDWLVSITITNTNGTYTSGTSLTNTSRTGLSAVTVATDLDPTPEPSTMAMIAGGLGVVAWVRRRRTA